MKFFVPDCADPRDAKLAHETVASDLRRRGFQVTQEKIFKIRYLHKGGEMTAQVGSIAFNNQVVMAIYSTDSKAYLVCTIGRGWNTDEIPILTGDRGEDTVLYVEVFDS
jgi:hypothetical protein